MMNCCNIKVPMKALAEKLKPLLGLDEYVEKNGGTLTNGVLSTPTIKGAVSLDTNATASLCSALEQCIRDYIADTPFVDNGEFVGSELVLKQGNTVIDRINLANLVPKAKADRFLSQVNYKPAQKLLEFVTSAQGEQNQTFTVPLDDLLNVNIAEYAGDGLEVRGGKLHIKDELCTLGVTNQTSYTVQNTDDVIVSDGGTITFPSSIPVGRAFTVIQATDTTVLLASDGTINPPLDKTLTMYGKNAVATVIKTGANVFYVSGDMQ